MSSHSPEHFETIVIGGGQAGLSTGYHLKQLNVPFKILDANERIGDSWRNRWDSLRLFSPARFSVLDGLKSSAHRHAFITKDEMADYLEEYAGTFDLPVQNSVHVESLTWDGGRFEVNAGERQFTANQVVVAMGKHQIPRVPSFAAQLAPAITQLHSLEYRNPAQLRAGGVLIVGAGNSGAEIAREVSQTHPVWVSGRNVGQVPFRLSSFLGRNLLLPIVFRVLFHRVLTVKTPIGKKVRPKILTEGGPLIRVRREDLKSLGVQFVGRTAGVVNGKPQIEDGAVLDVANVIWCTGFHPGLSWIELPVHGEHEPLHNEGVARDVPGLYFVGQEFQYALSSEMIHGVGRDALRIAKHVAERTASSAAQRERHIASPTVQA